MTRLKERYHETVVPALMEEFAYVNSLQVPRLTKITVNIGLGEAVTNIKVLERAQQELATVTGQWPVVARARKSIAGFKLREGMPIGTFVTLRRQRMWEFLDRLLNVALPRVRDFRGVNPRAFDDNGNYNLGVREQIIFPEIKVDQVDKIKGMNISIVTSAETDTEARELLKGLGMPFRD